jgi:hypothetical protein
MASDDEDDGNDGDDMDLGHRANQTADNFALPKHSSHVVR